MLDSRRLLHLTWEFEGFLCMMVSMEEFGHSMMRLMRLQHLALGWKAAWHPTLEDREVLEFTFAIGRVWEPTLSLGKA